MVPANEFSHVVGVIQPTKMKDGALAAWMLERSPDAAVVIAFGRILPLDVLNAPRRGCLNLHASILPKYRGAAPITWAIARGERETGVSLMQMDQGLDTGPVYTELRTKIGPDETAGELGVRLGALAAQLVRQALRDVVDGKLAATPQDHHAATLAPILSKEDGIIDWRRTPQELHDHVRAMQPWPGAATTLPGGQSVRKTLKILRTRVVDARVASSATRAPGVVLVADRNGAIIACGPSGEQTLAVLEAQPEGKRVMPAADLVNGRVLAASMTLG